MKQNIMKKNRIAAIVASLAILAGAGELRAQLIPMYLEGILSDDDSQQWEQPYYAYSGRILTDIDFYMGTKPGNEEFISKIVYKYNDQGQGVYIDQPYAIATDSTGKIDVKRYVYEESDTCNAYIYYRKDKDGNWYSDDTNRQILWHGYITEYQRFYWSSQLGEFVSPSSITSQYDEQGRPTVSLHYKNGVPEKKTEYTHDSETSVILTEYQWNAESSEWNPTAKIHRFYNSDWSLLLKQDYYRLTDNEWTLYMRIGYEYKENNVKCADWTLNFLADGSVQGDRKEFAVDSLGRQIYNAKYTLASFEPMEWVGIGRTDYEYSDYDTRGRKPTVTTYVWDNANSDWVYNHKDAIQKDDHGSVIFSASMDWDGTQWMVNGDWLMYEFIYDSENNKYPTFCLEYHSLPNDSSWSVYTYTHYDEHFCIERQQISYTENLGQAVITDIRHTEKTYNAQGLPDSVFLLHNDSLEMLTVYTYGETVEDISTRSIYSRKDGAWIPKMRIEYLLSERGDTLFTEYHTGCPDGTWQPDSRYFAEYDSEGRLIMDAYYNWNNEIQCFEGTSKWVSYYDEQGTKLGYAVYWWDYEIYTWYGLQNSLTIQTETPDGVLTVGLDSVWNPDKNMWELYSCDSVQVHTDNFGNLTVIDHVKHVPENIAQKTERNEFYHFVFNYDVPASAHLIRVEKLSDFITVQDCTVSVTAPDGGLIHILGLDGTAVASGTGTLNATLPAGLYIVKTDAGSATILLR